LIKQKNNMKEPQEKIPLSRKRAIVTSQANITPQKTKYAQVTPKNIIVHQIYKYYKTKMTRNAVTFEDTVKLAPSKKELTLAPQQQTNHRNIMTEKYKHNTHLKKGHTDALERSNSECHHKRSMILLERKGILRFGVSRKAWDISKKKKDLVLSKNNCVFKQHTRLQRDKHPENTKDPYYTETHFYGDKFIRPTFKNLTTTLNENSLQFPNHNMKLQKSSNAYEQDSIDCVPKAPLLPERPSPPEQAHSQNTPIQQQRLKLYRMILPKMINNNLVKSLTTDWKKQVSIPEQVIRKEELAYSESTTFFPVSRSSLLHERQCNFETISGCDIGDHRILLNSTNSYRNNEQKPIQLTQNYVIREPKILRIPENLNCELYQRNQKATNSLFHDHLSSNHQNNEREHYLGQSTKEKHRDIKENQEHGSA